MADCERSLLDINASLLIIFVLIPNKQLHVPEAATQLASPTCFFFFFSSFKKRGRANSNFIKFIKLHCHIVIGLMFPCEMYPMHM